MRKGKQLELNLTPRAGPPMESAAAWRYRFTDDGLIEEGGGTRYLYGLWSRQFGCWEVSTVNGAFRECFPTGVFLRPGGNWFGNVRIRPALFAEWTGERRAGWRFEANAAFAAFYADIPESIRQGATAGVRDRFVSGTRGIMTGQDGSLGVRPRTIFSATTHIA